MNIVIGITFIGVLALIVGLYWLFVARVEQAEGAELRKRLKHSAGTIASTKKTRLLKPLEKFSSVGALNGALSRLGRISHPVQRDITQAGLTISVSTVLLSALFLASVVYLAVRFFLFSSMLALGAAVAASLVPFIVLRRMRNRRLLKFEEQFPEAVDLLGRAIRAGHAFTTGVLMAAEEIPAPVGEEFKRLYDQQNFGMSLPDALHGFAARIPLIDARFFATAVLTQRETGGNLGEVLDNLAAVIRERFKVKRQVRVLTAHGRITGWILAGFPPALAAAMFIIAPQHMNLLITDPLGIQMIVGALTLQIIGTMIIRKLVNIPY
jgi:tight adherence protein B